MNFPELRKTFIFSFKLKYRIGKYKMPKKGKLPELEKQVNRAKVYMAIAKKPQTFTQLLDSTKLSRASLTYHLQTLQNEDMIYKDTIKPTETLNRAEVGNIVYKIKEDEMEKFLMETVMISLPVILNVIEDNEVRERLERDVEDITKAIVDYVNDLRASREHALKEELKRIKGK
jgi:DNA-binding transcriptional ArsR family regulator